jgi:hypothetical protein
MLITSHVGMSFFLHWVGVGMKILHVVRNKKTYRLSSLHIKKTVEHMGKGELLHTCDSTCEWMDANDDHALLIFMKFFY